MPTTNLPSGVTTVMPQRALGSYPMIEPFHSSVNGDLSTTLGVAEYKADFVNAGEVTEYTVTGVGTPAMALVTGAGGLAALTTTIGAADSVIAIKGTTSIGAVAGQSLWYLTRFALSDATTCAIVAGLKDAVSESNGIWFSKASASTSVSLNIKVATVATVVTGIATLANATYVDIGFYYDGTDLVVFVNDGVVARVANATLPTVLTTPIFSITNGSGVIRSMTVDYVLASAEVAR